MRLHIRGKTNANNALSSQSSKRNHWKMVKMEEPEKLEPIFGRGTLQEQAKRMAKSIAESEQNKATPSSILFPTSILIPVFPTYSPKERTVGIADFVKRIG